MTSGSLFIKVAVTVELLIQLSSHLVCGLRLQIIARYLAFHIFCISDCILGQNSNYAVFCNTRNWLAKPWAVVLGAKSKGNFRRWQRTFVLSLILQIHSKRNFLKLLCTYRCQKVLLYFLPFKCVMCCLLLLTVCEYRCFHHFFTQYSCAAFTYV